MLPLDVLENQIDHIGHTTFPTKPSTEKEEKTKVFQNNQSLPHIAHSQTELLNWMILRK